MEKQDWNFKSHRVLTRIPVLVGQVWELYNSVKLKPFQCCLACTPDVLHFGNAWLACDNYGYLLIKPIEEKENVS
jgi:hypothetical protein